MPRQNNNVAPAPPSNPALVPAVPVTPPPVTPPSAPTSLHATYSATIPSIELTWVNSATDATSIVVERNVSGGSFSTLATVAASAVSDSDVGPFADSTTYGYRVKASNSGGDSAYSNVAYATTPTPAPAPTAPNAPSGLTAQRSGANVLLAWVDNSTDETSFVLERQANGGGFSTLATLGANVVTVTDTTATVSGTTYDYRVKASNAVGDSSYSNTASVTLPTAPSAPSNCVAANTTGTVTVTWTDNATTETGFVVERQTGASAFTVLATVGANVTTYVDSTVAATTTYGYRVKATNAVGDSAYSNTSTVTTPTPTSLSVITPADFTFLGAFQLPNVGAGDSSYAKGLTHRVVSGQTRLFTTYLNGPLVEMSVPTLSASNVTSLPSGVVVRNWGSGYKTQSNGGPSGLYWDDPTQRLYWNFVNGYIGSATNTSFGWTTLNADGTMVTHGPFGFPNPPNYKVMKGMCAIPSVYQARVNGWRIAGGFGGYESIVATGPASLGTTVVPFDQAAVDALAANGYLGAGSVKILANHPFNQGARENRNGNLRQTYDSGAPTQWTWPDLVGQSAVWINTGTKQGFLNFVRQAYASEQTSYTTAILMAAQSGGTGAKYLLTLTAPLANLRVGDYVNVPISNSVGNYSRITATVNSFDSVSITLTLIPSGAEPNPLIATSGSVFRGTWYYASTGWTTEGRLALFVYDSEALLAGAAPDSINAVSETGWAIPTFTPRYGSQRIPSWNDLGPAGVDGATFDPTTNRLYFLIHDAMPYLGPPYNSVVFVYQLG